MTRGIAWLQAKQTLLIGVILVASWLALVWPLFGGDVVPRGSEYPVHITRFTAWNNARSCGWCFLWDQTGGGAPFFGDPYTAAQHPMVAVLGLATDPVTAANLTIAASFLLLGIAGWWYARLCGYGLVATLWTMLLLVFGGHGLGRLAIGSVALPLSVASFALCAVAVAHWLVRPSPRTLVVLTGATAGLLLAGQGYLQLVALLWVIPVLVIAARRVPARLLGRNVALLLAGNLVLCAPVVVGFVANTASMQKTTDEALPAYQALGYVLWNLVAAVPTYAADDAQAGQLFPYLFHNYIGVGTVIAALAGVGWLFIDGKTERQPTPHAAATDTVLLPLWLSLLLVVGILVSGALPQLLVATGIPALRTMVLGWRNLVLAGAVLPVVLVLLSGAAVERGVCVMRKQPGTRWSPRGWQIARVVCAAVLVGTIAQVAAANAPLVETVPVPTDATALMRSLDPLPTGYVETTDDMQYLAVLRAGQKNFWTLFYPYHPNDMFPPVPVRYKITAGDTVLDPAWEFVDSSGDLALYQFLDPVAAYAVISAGTTATDAADVCELATRGGDISLGCTFPAGATQTVHEYALPGWQATVDGKTVPLPPGPFLRLAVPAGVHTVVLQYRPWGVMGAVVVSLIGWVGLVAAIGYFCVKRKPRDTYGQ